MNNTTKISSNTSLFDLNLKEVIKYWDLCMLFVRRDFVSQYKQTILGPLWFFIQPIFTAYTFVLVLSNMGGLGTDGLPPLLFYIAGLTFWGYFRDCFTKTANTFSTNAGIFGKVYFPRVISPLSVIISQLIKLGIQFLLLVVFILYFHFSDDYAYAFHFQIELLMLPVLIIIMALLSLSFGMLISSLTTKYRDLQQLMGFGVQLLMYVSAVIISTSEAKLNMPKFAVIIEYNPIAQLIEAFKVSVLGVGEINWNGIAFSAIFTIVLFFISLVLFNKTEKNFMDTV